MSEIARTWIIPDDGDSLGVYVSTLQFDNSLYETMIVGGEYDATANNDNTRKNALQTHIFWINYLINYYGL
jgi:hypothetical protein